MLFLCHLLTESSLFRAVAEVGSLIRLLIPAAMLMGCFLAAADEPPAGSGEAKKGGDDAPLVLDPQVRDILIPLFTSISQADGSRVTAMLSAESSMAGKVVDSQQSTYQIASQSPNKYTIYLKEANQRTRIFGDGKSAIASLSPEAFVRLTDLTTQQAVISLPIPMGPYPEPILALSLAGVDPAISLLGGMKSVELVERKKFDDKTPAVHIRGIQKDAVTWDLWISEEDQARPLRLQIDLTGMLKSTGQVSVPDGFSYRLRVDFLRWRLGGDIDEKLFQFEPAKEATEYASLQEYYESISGVVAEHPLLGQESPRLVANTLDGKELGPRQFADKIVILEFWATWCKPCVAAIPVIKEVADRYADKDVVFYAVNTGEETALVKDFIEQQEWDVNVLVDAGESVAEKFRADAIPQTILIGKNGIIESVHLGFVGADELSKRLSDELDVLTAGGQIASATEGEK